jgi:hypothetical protein
MNLQDVLARSGGLGSIARELGIDQSQAATGAEALLPAILGGFKKQAQTQPGGLGGLGDLLGQLGGGGLMDQVLAPEPTNVAQGDQVLGEIFGSRDVSRTVAQSAASRTGLDPALLKKMLPMLAMLVAGYMAKSAHTARTGPDDVSPADPSASTGGLGGLGGVLDGMLGGGPRQGAGANAGAAGGLGSLGGLGNLIDMNGDGNALDDILRMAGKAMGR